MKFKILFPVLFSIMFHSYKVTAQEIKVEISKLKFSAEEEIKVTYNIQKEIDSLKLENQNFEIVSNPSKISNPGSTEVSFIYKALKTGRIKLPRVVMFTNNEVIKSNDLFVEITEQELKKEDLELVPYTAGFTFNISLPAYLSKTSGISPDSSMEYKSEKNDVHGYVIVDNKKTNNIPYTYSATDYRDEILKDFFIDEEKREVSKSDFFKKGDVNFIETDLTIFDKQKKKTVYYFIGIAETSKAFYRFISWTSESNKNKAKSDFENILYSIKD